MFQHLQGTIPESDSSALERTAFPASADIGDHNDGVANLRSLINSMSSKPNDGPEIGDGTPKTLTTDSGPLAFPRGQPPEHLAFVHKDDILDTQIEPDTVAALPWPH
jgi:hypothetical protein